MEHREQVVVGDRGELAAVGSVSDAGEQPDPRLEDQEPQTADESTPYWLRPVLFAKERVAVATKMAQVINESGENFSATANQTKTAMGVYVMVVAPGVDGGITIELPQDPKGVIVAFPKTRARKQAARLVHLTKHLMEEYDCQFVVPESYPLIGTPDQGKAGGVARIAALGPEGVGTMMASMREKRWASINDASMEMVREFGIMDLVHAMEKSLSDKGMLPYQRTLVRKRVAKILSTVVVFLDGDGPQITPLRPTSPKERRYLALPLASPILPTH